MVIFTFSTPDFKVVVYVKSCIARGTQPTVPGVYVGVMHEVGIYKIRFTIVQSYFTVVVGVVFKLYQDLIFLVK